MADFADEKRLKRIEMLLRVQLKNAGISLHPDSRFFPRKDLDRYSEPRYYPLPEYVHWNRKVTGAAPDIATIERLEVCGVYKDEAEGMNVYKNFKEHPNDFQKTVSDVVRVQASIHEIGHGVDKHMGAKAGHANMLSEVLLDKLKRTDKLSLKLPEEGQKLLFREDAADLTSFAFLKALEPGNPRIDEAISHRINVRTSIESAREQNPRSYTGMLEKFAEEFSGNKKPIAEPNIITANEFALNYMETNAGIYNKYGPQPDRQQAARDKVCADANSKEPLQTLKPAPVQ